MENGGARMVFGITNANWLTIFFFSFWLALPLSAAAQKLDWAVLAYGSTGANLTPFWVARQSR